MTDPCVDVKDKACVDECPVDCIYEGSRSLYINPNECVDCGACEPVCPTEAIFYEDDLPDEWAWYKDAAVSFFAEVGDLGGASAGISVRVRVVRRDRERLTHRIGNGVDGRTDGQVDHAAERGLRRTLVGCDARPIVR